MDKTAELLRVLDGLKPKLTRVQRQELFLWRNVWERAAESDDVDMVGYAALRVGLTLGEAGGWKVDQEFVKVNREYRDAGERHLTHARSQTKSEQYMRRKLTEWDAVIAKEMRATGCGKKDAMIAKAIPYGTYYGYRTALGKKPQKT